MALKGACLCGAVQYEVRAEPIVAGHCHCTRCQRGSGGGSVTGVLVPVDALEVVAGQELVTSYAEEGFTARNFCSRCGSQLYGSTAELAFVTAGTLESGSAIQPQCHMMVDFKAPWDQINDDLPQFGAFPPKPE